MADIVKSFFYLKTGDFDEKAFESYSTELFDRWDRQVAELLHLPDYALTLIIEEGSVKGKGKVVASLVALYFAIGSYGSFISGLKTIVSQAAYVTDTLFNEAKDTFGATTVQGNTKRNSGAVVYLQSLFYRVQRGEITPDEAMNDVRLRFGDEADSSEDFMGGLEQALKEAPALPEQLSLEDENWPQYPLEVALWPDASPHTPTPLPQPLPNRYRIEITRESVSKKKVVKITRVRP